MPKELYAKEECSGEVSPAVFISADDQHRGRDISPSSTDEEPARIAPADGPASDLGAALNRVLVGTHWVIALFAGTLLAVSGVGKLASLPIFAVVLQEMFPIGSTASSVLSVGVAALELSTGVTLIVHPRERFPSAVGAMLFAVFFMIQVRLTIVGASTECGCFGILQGSWLHRMTQNHWAMLVLDGAFAAKLYFDARSRVSKREPKTTGNNTP